jgi:hypothetical protein
MKKKTLYKSLNCSQCYERVQNQCLGHEVFVHNSRKNMRWSEDLVR